MEEIVYEIVGGALILGIVLLVIVVFRQSAGTIKDTVRHEAEMQDLTAIDTIGVDGGSYDGTKVQEAYSYSLLSDRSCLVYVLDGSSYKLIKDDATCNTYKNRNLKYTLTIKYLNRALTNSEKSGFGATTTNSISVGKNDPNIAQIIFIFKKK